MSRLIKVILLTVGIFAFIGILSFLRLILKPQKRTFIVSRALRLFNKMTGLLLGLRVKVKGKRPRYLQGMFFVSNHLSYLDGISISSVFPLVFIGRRDLRTWPVFGLLSALSDTVFVNRESPLNLPQEIERISYLLSKGVNTILFPEGTSTNGDSLLSFKSSFFEAPLKSNSRIIPLVIRYLKINKKPLNQDNRDLVYWYGDMGFLSHLWKVLSLKSIEVEIQVLPEIVLSQEEVSHSSLRKHLARISREKILDYLDKPR